MGGEEIKTYQVGGTTWSIPIALANKLDHEVGNANVSKQPRDPMSGVSGSSTCKQNVFLSHAGEDKAFVRFLYYELKSRQHNPFLDADPVSLPDGCDFPKTIFTAIKTCQVVLVILSQNFVTKKWPMLELVAAYKCGKNKESPTIIPIFYKLKVKEINKDNLQFLNRIWTLISELNPDDCRDALKKLKRSNGIANKGEEDDYVFAKTVVDRICQRVTPIRLWANDAMEMRNEWCEELDCCMRLESGRSCMFLGVWGSSGAGKTWIAMALCRHLYGAYNGRVYLLDVSKKNDKVALASALYEELYAGKLERANGVEDVVGQKLGDSMKDERLFLVLDNPILTEQGQHILQFVLDICLNNCQQSTVMITAPEERFLESLLLRKYNTDPKAMVKIMKVPSLTEDAAAKILYKTARPNMKTWDALDEQEQEAVFTVCTTYLEVVEYNPRQTQLLGNSIRSQPGNSSEAVTEWPKLEFDLSVLMKEQFQSMTANHLQTFCLDAALYDEAIQTTRNAICKWLGIIYGCQTDTVLTKLKQIRSYGQFLDWDDDGDDEEAGQFLDLDDGDDDEEADDDDDNEKEDDDANEEEGDDDDGGGGGYDPVINTNTMFAKFAMEQVLENPEKWGWFFYNQIAQEEERAAHTDSEVDKNQNKNFAVKDVKMIEKIALVGGRFKDVGKVLNLTRYSKAIAFVLSRCEKVKCLDVQWNKNIRVLEVDQCASLRAIEGLEDLTYLVCLRIVDCPKLALGHMDFHKFSRLVKLEISNTAMTQAPNLQGCSRLQELKISNTAITQAPNLQGFSRLQELILSGNEDLNCLPECWSGFPRLTKIDFSRNANILELPDLSPLASSLRSLEIYYCGKLKSVTCIPSLTALKTLDMDECTAIEISDSLTSFIQSLPYFSGKGLFQGDDDEHGEENNDDDEHCEENINDDDEHGEENNDDDDGGKREVYDDDRDDDDRDDDDDDVKGKVYDDDRDDDDDDGKGEVYDDGSHLEDF